MRQQVAGYARRRVFVYGKLRSRRGVSPHPVILNGICVDERACLETLGFCGACRNVQNSRIIRVLDSSPANTMLEANDFARERQNGGLV